MALSGRARSILAVAFLLAVIAFLPLRMALGVFGLGDEGLSARSLAGSVWHGRAEELRLGKVSIGTVDVGLSPFALLIGRARIGIERRLGRPDDIQGALVASIGGTGIDGVTGRLPLGGAMAPLPLSALGLTNVTIALAGDACDRAEGRVRADVVAGLPGLDLANGLSGDVRCDGRWLLVPLVSQSGTQRMTIRLDGAGRYRAEMRVSGADAATGLGLASAGFRAVGGDHVLNLDGRL